LNETLHRAMHVFHNQKNVWRQMMINGMTTDWSWTNSAKKYEQLYHKTIQWSKEST